MSLSLDLYFFNKNNYKLYKRDNQAVINYEYFMIIIYLYSLKKLKSLSNINIVNKYYVFSKINSIAWV